jgi:hypothetical protein
MKATVHFSGKHLNRLVFADVELPFGKGRNG